MLNNTRKFRADGVAVFFLGALFLFLSIGLVMLGGSVYRQSTATAKENDALRTTHAYLVNQIRRADVADLLQVGDLEGVPALKIYRNYDEYTYVIYLYCWDGYLRESFVEEGYELPPETGTEIMPLTALQFSVTEEGLLTMETEFADGTAGRLLVRPRCGLEGRRDG